MHRRFAHISVCPTFALSDAVRATSVVSKPSTANRAVCCTATQCSGCFWSTILPVNQRQCQCQWDTAYESIKAAILCQCVCQVSSGQPYHLGESTFAMVRVQRLRHHSHTSGVISEVQIGLSSTELGQQTRCCACPKAHGYTRRVLSIATSAWSTDDSRTATSHQIVRRAGRMCVSHLQWYATHCHARLWGPRTLRQISSGQIVPHGRCRGSL